MSKTSRCDTGVAGLDVWRFGYDDDVDASLLSDDERRRADRFATPALRARFVAQRAIVRELLAPYLGVAPRDIAFSRGTRGKPFVDGAHFNLSHSDDLALLAVAPFAVGVDVERVGHVDPHKLARVVLAPAEAACLEPRAFLRVWCRKEAYLKATGAGLVDDLTAISVMDDGIGDIAIRDLAIDDAHVAALAYFVKS